MKRFLCACLWVPLMAVVAIVAVVGGLITGLAAQLMPVLQRVTELATGDE